MPSQSYVNLFRNREALCENIVLTCVDFRFRKKAGELLPFAGYRDFDLLALPGASKAVLDEERRPVVFDALDICLRLHKVVRLIIIDHMDCGAYGGSAAFQNADEEVVFHTDRLREAGKIIRDRYPFLQVVPMYMGWDKLVSIDTEEDK
ncbi:MAG: hypothetical protein HYX78_00125 [Armatimonadetes bacterium]|nr:hypothetical protein [Armatimonadota bacterium]